MNRMGSKLIGLVMIAYGCYLLWGAKRDFTRGFAEGTDGIGQPFMRSREKHPVSYWLTLLWYCVGGPFLIFWGIYALIAL